MSNLRLAFQVTRSQLHVGTGKALGGIDRPVSRHIVTGHPNLPSSALKRALKDASAPDAEPPAGPPLSPAEHQALFGAPRPEAAADDADVPPGAAGMLAPQEGQLLLLPMACGAGGGAWATSPAMWQRLRRGAALAGVQVPPLPAMPATESACCPDDDHPLLTRLPGQNPWVVLASAVLNHQSPADAAAWTVWARWLADTVFAADDADWRALVQQRLVIISDTVFDRLLPHCLVDRERNSVGETVQLWREETVPEDAVFHALVGATPLPVHAAALAGPKQALDRLATWQGTQGALLQAGGNASLGQGLMRWHMVVPAGPAQAATPGDAHAKDDADAAAEADHA